MPTTLNTPGPKPSVPAAVEPVKNSPPAPAQAPEATPRENADTTAKTDPVPLKRAQTPFPLRPAQATPEVISTVGVPESYDGPNRPIAADAKPLSRMNAPDGLVIEDYILGKGPVCLPKAYITIKGIGRFAGTERTFANDYAQGKAASGNLDNLVPALQNGIVGMRVGGQRRIYADGNQGLSLFWKSQPDDKSRYGINKKTDLVYDIELMDVKSRFVPIAEPKAENAAPVETTPAAPATPKSP